MYKEVVINKNELEIYAKGLAGTFIQRWDLYPLQLEDGSYICNKKQLQMGIILSHLIGEITLGCYILNSDSQAKYIVFDADDSSAWDCLIQLSAALAQHEIPLYLDASRRGGHLWVFFSKYYSGKTARAFGHRLQKLYELFNIELFPKQSEITFDPGSLLRLPFGIHRKTGERFGFISSNDQPLALQVEEQKNVLCNPHKVMEKAFHIIMHNPSSS